MLGSLIGALIATYALSRIGLLLTRGLMPGTPALLLAHLASFILLAAIVGLLKSYFSAFAYDQALIFVPAQIVWLTVDLVRGKARLTA
jgi:flagellar biosynthesis protein FliQ